MKGTVCDDGGEKRRGDIQKVTTQHSQDRCILASADTHLTLCCCRLTSHHMSMKSASTCARYCTCTFVTKGCFVAMRVSLRVSLCVCGGSTASEGCKLMRHTPTPTCAVYSQARSSGTLLTPPSLPLMSVSSVCPYPYVTLDVASPCTATFADALGASGYARLQGIWLGLAIPLFIIACVQNIRLWRVKGCTPTLLVHSKTTTSNNAMQHPNSSMERKKARQ